MRARREPLICLGWLRSNGVIDRTIASTRSNSRSSRESSWSRIPCMPGIILSIDLSEPIFLMADICWRKSSKVKSSSARNLRAISSAWPRSNAFSACSMSVSTSPMSRMRAGHPVGVEDLEVLHALADRRVHDRPAGHRGHRQRGATAGVAVELGQDDAGEVDALLERLRRLDRGLADHRVDDEQDLVRAGWPRGCPPPAASGLVDGQPAGGVDDDHVVLSVRASAIPARATDDRVAERPRPLTGPEHRVVAADVALLRRDTPARRRARRRLRAG